MRKQSKRASIGIVRRGVKVLILVMTLIFLPQQILSQTVSIDQEKQTVTLDKEATIDKASIIKNAERLQEDNLELIEIVRKQDSIISSMAQRNIQRLNEIQKQNERIFELSGDLQRLTNRQLDYEEKKTKAPKLYAVGGLDYVNREEIFMPNVGVSYLSGKIGFGANIGLINTDLYYGGRVYISIF